MTEKNRDVEDSNVKRKLVSYMRRTNTGIITGDFP